MHMRNARCPARQFIDNEVAKLLQKEVIRLSEPEAEGQVISPISVREKKGGSHRIILNLKLWMTKWNTKHSKWKLLNLAFHFVIQSLKVPLVLDSHTCTILIAQNDQIDTQCRLYNTHVFVIRKLMEFTWSQMSPSSSVFQHRIHKQMCVQSLCWHRTFYSMGQPR